MRDAKSRFQQATLELKAARTAKATLERERRLSGGEFESASGPVHAIGLKWKTIEANESMAVAEKRVSAAQEDADRAAAEVLRIHQEEQGLVGDPESKGIAAIKQ